MAESDALFEALYDELRAHARRLFRSQNASHTLQPTAVVHEAFLKMEGGGWNDRAHFFRTAARAMRQILVNHARDRKALKRGGGQARRVTLADAAVPGRNLEVVSLHEALDELAEVNERHARLAELKLFAGLTNEEAAEALDTSLRTTELDWKMVKAWLAERLGS